jgi:hypothetical protein
MSVYTTIFAGSTPVGGPLMGGFASAFGVAISLAIGGVVATIVGLGAFVWIRRSGLDRITLRPSSVAIPVVAAPSPVAAPARVGDAVRR